MTTCTSLYPKRYLALTRHLLTDLVSCWQRPVKEILKVEAAFLLTKKHCGELKHACWEKPFESDEEAMAFVRLVHPQFSGRMIYYSILYEALLSLRKEQKTQLEFWKKEQLRLGRFTQKNRELIDYLDSGATDRDSALFLQNNQRFTCIAHTELFNCGPEQFSSVDALPSHLFAERQYHEYVQARLSTLLHL